MAKVTMHKANDGSLHNTAKECEARNTTLRLAPTVEAFVTEIPDEIFSGDSEGCDLLYRSDLSRFIIDNADALRKILNDALIVRRKKAIKKATAPALAVAA